MGIARARNRYIQCSLTGVPSNVSYGLTLAKRNLLFQHAAVLQIYVWVAFDNLSIPDGLSVQWQM